MILSFRGGEEGLVTSFLLTSVGAEVGSTGLGGGGISSGQFCLLKRSVNLRMRFRDGFMMPSQLRGCPPSEKDELIKKLKISFF